MQTMTEREDIKAGNSLFCAPCSSIYIKSPETLPTRTIREEVTLEILILASLVS